MQEQGHGTGHRVGNSQLVQPLGDVSHRVMNGTILLEVQATLLERPVQLLVEPLFLSDHGTSPFALYLFSLHQLSGRSSNSPRPRAPSSRSRSPVRTRRKTPAQLTRAGFRASRSRIDAWLSSPPTSATTPATR